MNFEIQMVPVERLKPAAYNPRRKLRRGDPEYDDIANSLQDFGLVQNLVWNKQTGNLVAGHQRLLVAVNETAAHEMPCFVVDLDDEEERRLNVILNRVGEGLWDQTKLTELFRDLESKAVDLHSMGWTPQEVEEILGLEVKEPDTDPDEKAPAPSKEPITKTGDQYLFMSSDGQPQHHLRCGDSTSADDLAALMGESKARLLFTDPPYGVDYDNSKIGRPRSKEGFSEIENDLLKSKELAAFIKAAFQAAIPYLRDNSATYCWHPFATQREFQGGLEAAGYKVRQQLIWLKSLTLSRSDYHWSHELCFYCSLADGKTPWFGDRCETTFFEDSTPDWRNMKKPELLELLENLHESSTTQEASRDASGDLIHPTQKPIALARRAMKNSTLPKDDVLDLFGGSGSTLIAAEIERRNAYLMEMSPAYCDSIAKRYGKTFQEVLIYRNGEEVDPETLLEL